MISESGDDHQSSPVERAVHDFEADTSLSTTVMTAVARAKGVDPVDLRPLSEVLDPDALDALFARRPSRDYEALFDASVHFTFDGFAVTVRGDGEITVRRGR